MSETTPNGHTNGKFTSTNGHEARHNSHIAKRAASPRTAYGQAVALQQLLLNDAREPELKPIFRAGLARAWCELEECKRKLKMKPLPGSLRPTESRAKRKVKESVTFAPAPVETLQKPQDVVEQSKTEPQP